jgi:hypothetical protein
MKSPVKTTFALLVALAVQGFFPSARAQSGFTHLLFYYSADGSGADGHFATPNFFTDHTYGPGSLGAGWTHVAGYVNGPPTLSDSRLFYNSGDGSAADGYYDSGLGQFVVAHTYAPGSFSAGWTNIAGDGAGHLFFCNSGDGSAADGHIDFIGGAGFVTDHNYGPGFCSGFSGFTNIVGDGNGRLLFYNSGDGSAADGHFDSAGNGFILDHFYFPLSFGLGWTNIVTTNLGLLLFYNSGDGSGAIGHLDSGGAGFITDLYYPAGSFGIGFTHVASDYFPGHMLFYNSGDGSGAIGHLDGHTFVTDNTYGPGGFSPGWSLIIGPLDSTLLTGNPAGSVPSRNRISRTVASRPVR